VCDIPVVGVVLLRGNKKTRVNKDMLDVKDWMDVNERRIIHLSSATVAFAVMLGLILVVLGQQQIVVNSDFRDGLLGWNIVVVNACTLSSCGPRAPYPRIEPIASCNNYMSSEDGFCISFDTPDYSNGYIKQSIYIPNGPSLLEIKYKNSRYTAAIGSAGIKIYVELVELDTNKVTDFVLEPAEQTRVWRAPISHLSGKNVELRFGVKGEDCLSTCYTYVDYIKIFINSTTPTTTTAFTTHTTTLTSTETRTVTSFTYVTVIITVSVTETVGKTHVVTLTTPTTITIETTMTRVRTITEEKTESTYSTIILTKTNTFLVATTISLTNTMVQLPFFTVGIDALYYFSTVGAFILAVGVFFVFYDALRPSKERITRRMAFGLAIIYAFFAGIFIWPLIPLFLRGDPLSLIFTQYVYNLIVLVLLLIFAIPTAVIYARMLSRHNKSSQS
jgi:hypothetical protein